jgi:hypothetical protein
MQYSSGGIYLLILALMMRRTLSLALRIRELLSVSRRSSYLSLMSCRLVDICISYMFDVASLV